MGDLTPDQLGDAIEKVKQLRSVKPTKPFVVFLDTDGTALKNMDGKQYGVFHRMLIEYFNFLNQIPTFTRLHAENHNLWLPTRGYDRYPCVDMTLGSILEEDEEAQHAIREAGIEHEIRRMKASLKGYLDWIETTMGDPDPANRRSTGLSSLKEFYSMNGTDYTLAKWAGWTEAVDNAFLHTTLKMPAIAGVHNMVKYIAENAILVVVSGTPFQDLTMWWDSQGLRDDYITAIGSKEIGKKFELIEHVMSALEYEKDHYLMIGDGGGDMKAATYFPIPFAGVPPGQEETFWATFKDQVFDPFLRGEYSGTDLEQGNWDRFDAALLETAPWKLEGYIHAQEYMRKQPQRIAIYQQLGLPAEELPHFEEPFRQFQKPIIPKHAIPVYDFGE